MNTVNEIFSAQIEIKKSNFLSFLVPIKNFQTIHENLKNEHPKAAHIVWATRELNKYEQILENQSDDGEPKNTSGIPSLNALRGAQLVNVGVFIARYFGGVKLGTGGLVRAYSTAVNTVIDAARLVKFELNYECKFFTLFSLVNRFEHYFISQNFTDFEREFNEFGALWTVKFNQEQMVKFHNFAYDFSHDGFEFIAMPLNFAKKISPLMR
ncbi:MAG: IMPACT family protein [Campylobacter sp.]